MASSNCWKCLARPTTASHLNLARLLPSPAAAAAPFSSTAFLSAPPKPVKKQKQGNAKGGTLKLRNKKRERSGKPPASGERKALRKRIVLSNTNALEVEGMQDFDKALLTSLAVERNSAERGNGDSVIGKVVGLKGETVDSLRACEAFKITQGWSLFRRPSLLIREESVTMSEKLGVAQNRKETLKIVVDGTRSSGKSMMLLHAMATAFVKGWIVINIPDTQEVVNAVTAYAPIEGTKPRLWSQPKYTATWLEQISKANGIILDGLFTSQEYTFPGLAPTPAGISLTRLCQVGAQDEDVAWPVFQAFWSEITAAGNPPILMCVDNLSLVMRESLYRAPNFELIHTHDLVIVRHCIGLLSGATNLPNGGAVVAATQRSHAVISKSMDIAITQAEDKQENRAVTPRDPFEREYDTRADEALKNIEVLKLKGLSKPEARGLMEYWAKSGVLRHRVDEKIVAEKWAVAGNGIVGEITRNALWMRI